MSTALVPSHVSCLDPFVDAGVFEPAEVHFAAWLARAGDVDDPRVVLGAAAAAWAARHGHACADLALLAAAVSRAVGEEVGDVVAAAAAAAAAPLGTPLVWPEAGEWCHALRDAGAGVVREVTTWDPAPVFDPRPLVLFDNRLFLQRHWMDECSIAAALRVRAVGAPAVLAAGAAALLDRLLPTAVDGEANEQRAAADLVLARRLSVIAGGPGTGKTYTVARLLAVLLTDAHERGVPLRIGLAAPTGKAATRLHESITAAVAEVGSELSDDVARGLGELAPSTIHRLLGSKPPPRQRFRHNAEQPLPHDLVLVDETSMVAAPLLARLVEALRPDTRLVLVGDPDQLESVELGAVLADIVVAAAPGVALDGSVVRLTTGHRFGGTSPIATLADNVRRGDEEGVLDVLRSADGASLQFVEADDPLSPAATRAVETMVTPALGVVRSAARSGDAPTALAALAGVRVLCAHRHGPFGVADWNRLGENWLNGAATRHLRWYPGRPLLVTRNTPRLGLVNGDTGVVVDDGEQLMAAFAGPSGPRLFALAQLDDVETAYAMTVHKSQGSEYPAVAVVLPPAHSPLVGRELLYTAVTRARAMLLVVGTEESVRLAVRTPARRMTGLADALS